MSEVWRGVREFPDHYEVSNLGRVRRTHAYRPSLAGRIRKPQYARNGYAVFSLSVDNCVYMRSVHRMVADAFLGPIPEGMQVNHKNGNKADNRLENLEIVTNAQNRAHSYRVLGIAPNKTVEGNGNAKLDYAKVDAIRAEYKAGGTTHPRLAEKYGVCRATVLRLLNNQAWREEDRPSTP